MDPNGKKLAVVGGGISGLSAAYEALEHGHTNIHVYEASQRFGGKIENGMVGGQVINKGGECIDSDQEHLVGLARKLGVGLIENQNRNREEFQRPDGSIMATDKFYESYRPYAEQVMRDRAELQQNPNGPRAHYLNGVSLAQYQQDLEANVVPPSRSLWRWLADTFTLRGDQSKLSLTMATNSFGSELGQPIRNISAIQFINETSDTPDGFLAGDEKYRIEGGTEALIIKLRETLAARGVHFHTGAELTKIDKLADGKTSLLFKNPEFNNVTDQTILALPAYGYAAVKGLSSIGLSPQSRQLLDETQYTKNFKLAIAFRPGMEPPQSAFYSPDGFQCWHTAPGVLSILSNVEDPTGRDMKTLILDRLESYAKAHGSTADKMFDLSFPAGTFEFNNPGSKACYASPKPGQVAALESLRGELPALAKNGIGIAGTFLPHDGGIGFMECGVVSAKQAVTMLMSPAVEQSQPQRTPQQWQDYVTARTAHPQGTMIGA